MSAPLLVAQHQPVEEEIEGVAVASDAESESGSSSGPSSGHSIEFLGDPEAEESEGNGIAEADREMGPLEQLLYDASTMPSADFQIKLGDVDEVTVAELRSMLEQEHARDDPRWLRACGARPTRRTLLRIVRAAGVRVHPNIGWLNYADLGDFRSAVKELEQWYKPGRMSRRPRRRGIVRVEDASEQVVRRKTVWSKKVAAVHARILDPVTLEGLWNWREIALAMRDVDLAVLSGTAPVQRLWGNGESFFPTDASRITESWFNFLELARLLAVQLSPLSP